MDLLLCLSFPQFFERESRVFYKEMDSGLRNTGLSRLSRFFGDLSGNDTFNLI